MGMARVSRGLQPPGDGAQFPCGRGSRSPNLRRQPECGAIERRKGRFDNVSGFENRTIQGLTKMPTRREPALAVVPEAHRAALGAMCALSEQATPWGIPWPCVHEFLAVVTHPRICSPTAPLAVAVRALSVWLESAGCVARSEGSGYLDP